MEMEIDSAEQNFSGTFVHDSKPEQSVARLVLSKLEC